MAPSLVTVHAMAPCCNSGTLSAITPGIPLPTCLPSAPLQLGVLIGLIGEATTGLGLAQQTSDHPLIVFGIFLLISFASYVPIAR